MVYDGVSEDKQLKVVSKVSIEDIPNLKRKGYNVKLLPLNVARELFGDEVFKNAGDHVYVSLDAHLDIVGLKVTA